MLLMDISTFHIGWRNILPLACCPFIEKPHLFWISFAPACRLLQPSVLPWDRCFCDNHSVLTDDARLKLLLVCHSGSLTWSALMCSFHLCYPSVKWSPLKIGIFFSVHVMIIYRSGGTVPLIQNLGTRRRWVVNFSAALRSGSNPLLINTILCGPRSRLEFLEKEIFFCSYRDSKPGSQHSLETHPYPRRDSNPQSQPASSRRPTP
jgi:hypothetical protein